MVINLKKILLIIIIFFVILSNINIKGKELYGPGIYYVELNNLTIDNIDKMISDEIIAVEPYINPLYNKCVIIEYETKDKTKEKIEKFYKQENIKKSNNIKRVVIYSKTNLNNKYINVKKTTNISCRDT